jgi:biopolymer transport protein TolR
MGMALGSGGGLNADINVTPMIDVLLVLLIIFMVITPLTPKGRETAAAERPHDCGAGDRPRAGRTARSQD